MPTVPLIAAALAWIVLKEKPGRSAITASIISLAGVLIITGFGKDGNAVGDLLALGMTICLAVMMIISRLYPDIPTLPAAALSALLSGLVALPFSSDLAISLPELKILMLFGLVNSALGISLFTLGSKLLPATETALIGTLDAPLAPIWVWLVFAETPSTTTLAGGTVIFTAILVHTILQSRRQQRPTD